MLLPLILTCAAGLGVVGGLAGYAGTFTHWQADFRDQVAANLWRPRRYMATWGVHLGGYVGGLVGTVWAATFVFLRRRRAAQSGQGFPVVQPPSVIGSS